MHQVHPRVSSPMAVSVSSGDDEKFCHSSASPATFTVWKRSLIFNANGFTVFDSSGNLIFRVDNYSSNPKHKLFLMDATGGVLLTLLHKRLSFNDRWEAFRGDGYGNGYRPAFSVIKSVSTLFSNKPSAKAVLNPTNRRNTKLGDYEIEGSFCKTNSSITVFGASREIIAQATRKQATSGIMLGDDVLSLVVQPGIDQTFVMGFLIIFNQIMSRAAQAFSAERMTLHKQQASTQDPDPVHADRPTRESFDEVRAPYESDHLEVEKEVDLVPLSAA